MHPLVLIIDDEKKIAALMARIIELEGIRVLQAHTGKEGMKLLASQDIDVVISDVKLPDVNGVELVKQIKASKPHVQVINLTAYGTIADGVLAMKNGAYDYITKGDDNDRIIPLLHMALAQAQKERSRTGARTSEASLHTFSSIIGQSRAVNEAVELARKVAETDTTVLLLGETGTGKEVFAQAIHSQSARSKYPFVALNCSGFKSDLLESELFGYKAGAFTGANKDKKGLLEEADGGTLFLDEIGEMDIELQAKLLRVLEERSFIKVGDTRTSRVNVRILAATNRGLQEEAERGNFRLDLYYRLSVFTIEIPPLSQRKGDIRLLADHYLNTYAARMGKKGLKLSASFYTALENHPWKGNIRELRNVMERVAILAGGGPMGPELLPANFTHQNSPTSSFDIHLIEKDHIGKVLQYTHGNKSEAARLLGIGLTTLYRKLDEYKL